MESRTWTDLITTTVDVDCLVFLREGGTLHTIILGILNNVTHHDTMTNRIAHGIADING